MTIPQRMAIQLILFTPDVQDKARRQEKVDDRIRNDKILPHTVEYWYETIHALSPNSGFILVQNKKDKKEERQENKNSIHGHSPLAWFVR